jgi:hypothetical protein
VSPAYPFPDAHAHGIEAQDEPTYDVQFRSQSQVNVWRVMLVADGEVQGFYRQFGFAPRNDVMAMCDPQQLFDRTE